MFHPSKNNLSRAMTKINKCHRCGATSYKPVIKRDESGTMMPSGEHQCVGASLSSRTLRLGERHQFKKRKFKPKARTGNRALQQETTQ
jgi:hypothetical protein